MVVVHRAGALRFVIYTLDHRPAHVHVIGPDGQARIDLGAVSNIPEVMSNAGLAATDLRRAFREVIVERARLIEAWRAIHGPD